MNPSACNPYNTVRHYQDIAAGDIAHDAPPPGYPVSVCWGGDVAGCGWRRMYIRGAVTAGPPHVDRGVVEANARFTWPRGGVWRCGAGGWRQWAPGDRFANATVLQLLLLAPHPKVRARKIIRAIFRYDVVTFFSSASKGLQKIDCRARIRDGNNQHTPLHQGRGAVL